MAKWSVPEIGTSSLRRAAPVAWSDPRVLAACVVQLLTGVYLATGRPSSDVGLAYIDPGSGALLLQIVLSFFVGLLFYLRSVRRFVGELFARLVHRGVREKSDTQA